MYKKQIIDLFTKLNYPESLTKQYIFPIMHGHDFYDRKTLLHINTVPKNLYFVAQGYGRISYLNDDQQKITAQFVKPIQFCNLNESFLKQVPSLVRLEAYKNSYIYSISYEDFIKLYKSDQQFKGSIAQLLAKQLEDKSWFAEILKIDNPAFARLDAYLPLYPKLKTYASNPEIASKLELSSTAVWRYFKGKKQYLFYFLIIAQ